jgi:hypothetical protein
MICPIPGILVFFRHCNLSDSVVERRCAPYAIREVRSQAWN